MPSKPNSKAKILKTLMAISMLPRPGPAPAFSHVHVCSALLAVGDNGPIGRIELSRRLGLGEGAIRTVIKHLTVAKLVATEKDGCVLTKRGTSLYNELRRRLSRIQLMDARQLSLDKMNAAILVRGAAPKVKRGIEQRDAAIRAGATGACTLIVRGGEFLMPMGNDQDWRLQSDDPLAQDLASSLGPKDKDVVAVVSAPDKDSAERGAMAAALTLLE